MYSEEQGAKTKQVSLFRRYLNAGFDVAAPDLKSTVLNSLASYFTPAVSRTLQDTLKNDFDPLILGDATFQDLGETAIGPCNTSATIIYDMKVLEGLGSVRLDNINMVPESDNISVSILDGATWNITWIINATFANLTAAANATLHIDACGNPIDQALSGVTVVDEPSISLTMYVQGETSNLILFQSTSKVVNADIMDLTFHYKSVEAHLGSFGDLSQVDLGVKLGEMLHRDATALEQVMKDTLQTAIDEELPFKPDSF